MELWAQIDYSGPAETILHHHNPPLNICTRTVNPQNDRITQ